jgi:KipI family sensor histidine kinase inhibitor
MPAAASDPLELPVRYDGPDLGEVADLLGLSPEAVVALHTGSVWTAAFGGFAPGFAYLVTDHERLAVPRRTEPRVAVPGGAVGLAGPFSGVYPRASPGGWRLIGTTGATLWDAERGALLRPGTRVRFRPVRS